MKVVDYTDSVPDTKLSPNDIVKLKPRFHTAWGTHAIILRDPAAHNTTATNRGYRVLLVGAAAGSKLFSEGSNSRTFRGMVERKLVKDEYIQLIVE